LLITNTTILGTDVAQSLHHILTTETAAERTSDCRKAQRNQGKGLQTDVVMSNHGKITQRSSATFLGDMAKSSRVTKRLSTPTLHPNLHYNAGQLHNSAGRLMMLLNSLLLSQDNAGASRSLHASSSDLAVLPVQVQAIFLLVAKH
jgi:hypothetical protein